MAVQGQLFAAPATSGQRRIARVQAELDAYAREMRARREDLRRLEAGEAGERRVVAELAAMRHSGWHTLGDRLWPGTRAANIDAICIGPGGVLVVDVKTWSEPRVEHGMLWRGQADASDEIDKLLAAARLVEEATNDLGDDLALVPREVVPLIVLAGRADPPVELGRVTIVGEAKMVGWAHRRGIRLRDEQVS